MKKPIILLVISCLILGIVGCGNKNEKSQNLSEVAGSDTNETDKTEEAGTKEVEKTEETKEASKSNDIKKEEMESTLSETTVPEKKEWELEVFMNTDENDLENHYRVVDYGVTTVFAHCIVKNMPEDTNYLDTYGVWEHPNGTNTYYIGGFEVEIGGQLYYAWQYMSGDEVPPLLRGTYTVTIYNSETDERLGGGSIRVE